MNKQFAAAWDEVALFAQERSGSLAREGHRFYYTWQADVSALPGVDEAPVVAVWAEENLPRFGVRVGEVSARVWTMEAAGQVIAALSTRTRSEPEPG